MISKQLKNAYYVEIINTATDLLDKYNRIELKTERDSSQHEFPNIKMEVSNLNRIYNNALIILLKGGMKFSTGSDKWNGSGKAIIRINGKNHEATMQNVKTILGGGYEKILDECFSDVPYDNIVALPIENKEIEKSYSKLFKTFIPKLTQTSQESMINTKLEDIDVKDPTGTEPVEDKPSGLVHDVNHRNKTSEPATMKDNNEVDGHMTVRNSNKEEHNVLKEKGQGKENPQTTATKRHDVENGKGYKGKTEARAEAKVTSKKSGLQSANAKKNNSGSGGGGDKGIRKPTEKPKPVKQKAPIFDDIDEFFDEIGEDIEIRPKMPDAKPGKIATKPTLIKRPVLSMDREPSKTVEAAPKNDALAEPANLEKKPRKAEPVLETDDVDILSIDDEDDISAVRQNEEEDAFVSTKQLLMDVYKIKKLDPEINESKEFTILVAPLNNPGMDEFKSPIFAFGRTGRISSTACSTTADKPLIQLIIDGEAFIIRGSWSEGDFVSLVYPQNVDNQNISVTNIKKMRPDGGKFIGHNLFHVEGFKFHILPLASSNNKNDCASFIMCVENPKSRKYEMAELMKGNNVLYKYSDVEYKVFAKWKNEKLMHELL